MATIKHLTSKNSNYAAAESYLTFQHNEYTGLPILDEKGRPKLRDSYLLDTLECGDFSFATACLLANRKYGKNTQHGDIKSHQYIISFAGEMSLFRLPRGKLSLAFLAVPAGKDGRVECPCQTVDDFIGVRGSVCGLFLFVQTHAPLDIDKQHTMCLLLCCLVFNICECGFQRSKIVLMLVNDLQNHITLCIIGHLLQLVVE